MVKKIFLLLFTALCLILCIIPSAGMIFAPSNELIGNEKETPLPSWTAEDGSFNLKYFTELGKYFETHFAFRAETIDADAKLMAGVFQTSDIDTVTVGTDGWLYYSSTLADYRGDNLFTERETADLVHNLQLIRDYAKSQGAEFLFTVAPNKNTLYPEHMPYYIKAEDGKRNRDLVNEALADSDIPYVNLFTLFEEQDEELYFARDSHWNNQGALMVYDAVLTALGKAHDDYSTAAVSRKKDFFGDLAAMLYPKGAEAEYNSYYGAEDKYSYTTDTKSVEDSYIQTQNPSATGSLYMYRDSFGNSLLPFFAGEYNTATFTKAFPMILEFDLQSTKPDTFVMELVERNLDWLITRPPIFSSPRMTCLKAEPSEEKVDYTVEAKSCQYSPMFLEFSGTVDSSALDPEDIIYVSVTDNSGKTSVYECYGLTCDEDGKTAFAAYTHADEYAAQQELDISVIIQKGDGFIELGTDKVKTGGNDEK
jgi:hypothetical protein